MHQTERSGRNDTFGRTLMPDAPNSYTGASADEEAEEMSAYFAQALEITRQCVAEQVKLQPGDACPSCGGELHRARHRFGEGASGNLPDCEWLHCLDCGYRTEPE